MTYLPNPFFPHKQCYRVYEALLCGPVTNRELHRMGPLNVNARISDIRKRIQPHGSDVLSERHHDGIWAYRLKPLPEKKEPPPSPGFWAKVGGWFGVGGH